jgi:acetylornithine/N-succinyldiaminopimelate aminotransferase
VLATEAAAAGMTAGTHGSTYGGNPLGCAIGKTVLDIVARPEFLAEVNRKASPFRQKLEGLVAAHPDTFAEVRGQGLIVGLKCVRSNLDVVAALRDEALLTVPAADNAVRLLPPLTVTDEELTEAVARLDRAASALASKAA